MVVKYGRKLTNLLPIHWLVFIAAGRVRRSADGPLTRLLGLAGQTLELECPLAQTNPMDSAANIEWRKGKFGLH